jgi:hypothetical protein
MSQISFRQEEARLRRRVLAIRHLLEIAHLKKPQQASQFSKTYGRA